VGAVNLAGDQAFLHREPELIEVDAQEYGLVKFYAQDVRSALEQIQRDVDALEGSTQFDVQAFENPGWHTAA
jgi:hypothetical protein